MNISYEGMRAAPVNHGGEIFDSERTPMRRIPYGLAVLLGTGALLAAGSHGSAAPKPIRVVIWDEQQPIQKQAYENFLGNEIAAYLRAKGRNAKGEEEITVRSVRLDDPQQG